MPIFRVPREESVLIKIGQGGKYKLSERDLNLLVWNVYKGQKGDHFREDFKKLAKDKDFILLQEAMVDQHMPKIWTENFVDYEWSMAQSFQYKKGTIKTGVCIGSRWAPETSQYVRGKTRELWWLTPKMSLFCEYDFGGVKVLMVCVHVLNFATTKAFIGSIQEIAEKIRNFGGPVVLAGDFNTWNVQRYLAMKDLFHSLQLEHVDFDQDWRLLRLDHVFVRGFKVKNAQVHHTIASSDHFPLELALQLL